MSTEGDKYAKMNASIIEITGLECLRLDPHQNLLGSDSDSDDESHSLFGNDSAALAKKRRSSGQFRKKKLPLDDDSASADRIETDDDISEVSYLTESVSSIHGYDSSPELTYPAAASGDKLKPDDILHRYACDPNLAPESEPPTDKQKQAVAA